MGDTRTFLKMEKGFLLSSVLSLGLGVVLAAFPGKAGSFICYIAGAFLLLLGAFLIIDFFAGRGGSRLSFASLAGGVLLAALGIFVLVRREIFLAAVPFFFGLFAVLAGLVDVRRALLLRKISFERWYLPLIFGGSAVVLGIVIMARPFRTAVLSIAFIGVALIFSGLTSLWDMWTLYRAEQLLGSEMEDRNFKDH